MASQLAIFPRNLPDSGRRLSLGAKEGPQGLLLKALGWGWGARELGPQILILCSLSLETLSTVTKTSLSSRTK